jgi:glycosyltransferase involved in cell wall biosynthesis
VGLVGFSTDISRLEFRSISATRVNDCYEDDLVSIIITSYNSAGFILSSLESIASQSYKNIEIIIVDDGSTDDTLDVIEEFKNSHIGSMIVVIGMTNNHGTYIAKNIGMTYSKGKYIGFHDSDDWAHPQRIENHLSAQKTNQTNFSISKLLRVSGNGRFISKYKFPLDRLSMVSLIIDRDVFNKLGFFRKKRFGSDSEYFKRIQRFTGGSFSRIDKVLMLCSSRDSSLTNHIDTGLENKGAVRRKHFAMRWTLWHDVCERHGKIPYVTFDETKYDYKVL